MAIIDSSTLGTFQDVIAEWHNDVARPFTLYINPPITGCPNCIYDPITKRSTNRSNTSNPFPENTSIDYGVFGAITLNMPFTNGEICPVCFGEGKIFGPTGMSVSGRIWHTRKDLVIVQGQEMEMVGDLRIKVTGNKDDSIYTYLRESKGAYVDNKYYQILGEPYCQGLSTGNVIVTHWNLRD